MESLKHSSDETTEDVSLQHSLKATVAERVRECVTLFKTRLASSGSRPGDTGYTIIDDQRARFDGWVSKMYVHEQPKVSLDYKLGFDTTAAETVHEQLDVIHDNLQSLAPVESPPLQSSSKRHCDEFHWQAIRRASDDASGLESHVKPAQDNNLENYKAIDEAIKGLGTLSQTIQNSFPANRAREIERYGDDEETNGAMDKLHGITNCYIDSLFPEVPDALRSALVEANAMRLRRLYYERSLPGRISCSRQNPEASSAVFQVPDITAHPLAVRSASRALRLPATTNKMRAKSIALDGKLKLPHIPQTRHCPYCGDDPVRPGDTATSLQWQNHFLEDLEPFICVYPDCLAGSNKYGAAPLTGPFHDPIHFVEPSRYEEHAIKEHGWPVAGVGTSSDTAQRRVVVEKLSECSFGDDFEASGKVESRVIFSSKELESHVADHMKEIALLTFRFI